MKSAKRSTKGVNYKSFFDSPAVQDKKIESKRKKRTIGVDDDDDENRDPNISFSDTPIKSVPSAVKSSKKPRTEKQSKAEKVAQDTHSSGSEDIPKKKKRDTEKEKSNDEPEETQKKKSKKSEAAVEITKQTRAPLKERATDTNTISKEKYDQLKEKYDQLKSLRETEVERLYQELKKNSQQREEASKELIEQLKKEQERLQAQLKSKKSDAKSKEVVKLEHSISELEASLNKLKEESSQKERVLNFYERLCGIKSTANEEESNRFHCTCYHTKDDTKRITFELTLSDEVEFSPLHAHSLALLPDYMKETICFQEQELPIFLSKMLTSLYKKQSNECDS